MKEQLILMGFIIGLIDLIGKGEILLAILWIVLFECEFVFVVTVVFDSNGMDVFDGTADIDINGRDGGVELILGILLLVLLLTLLTKVLLLLIFVWLLLFVVSID